MSTTVLTGTGEAGGTAGATGSAGCGSAVEQVGSAEAWELASRVCAAAGWAAQSQCALLELIGEFDAVGAVRWWQDIKSLAHWLSWACSMSPGTAREHVRVARALRGMPTVTGAFREGRLSYSKVREVTRVVGVIDEVRLCELALTATASQLARMVSAFRGAAGHRVRVEREREFRWTVRDSGLVDVRIRLPKEEAAVLLAAVNAAKDHHTPQAPPAAADVAADVGAEVEDPPRQDGEDGPDGQDGERVDATPRYGLVDAVVDLARDYLAMAPVDRSGEDRATVVVHVAADHLADHQHPDRSTTPDQTKSDQTKSDQTKSDQTTPDQTTVGPTAGGGDGAGSVPAGTPTAGPTTSGAASVADTESGSDVPAGTHPGWSTPVPSPNPECQVQGLGGIEPETARKVSCEADLVGAVVDATGDVLALGRTRRLVSRGQRRALMIRDHGMCQFPGCHQTRHLKAHHIVHWADGGRTDLDNLVLVCQFHHTAVHEGQMTITRACTPGTAEDGTGDGGTGDGGTSRDEQGRGAGGVWGRRWEFRMPDGTESPDWWTAATLATHLARHTEQAEQAERQQADLTAWIEGVDHWDHPDAARIRPGWAGEPFDLHACVEALFSLQLPGRETHQLAA